METKDTLSWAELPKPIQGQFLETSRLLELKRGEHIYTQGHEPEAIYFVKRGLVGLVLTSSTGKEHLLRFFREGQVFGHRSLFSKQKHHASTVALDTTQVLRVPKEIFLKTLDENPTLYKQLVQVLSKELGRCEIQRVMILENQILARTAQSLVYLKDLHPDHSWTRQEIANFCASTVSTVIKAMAKLESLGLIRQEGRSIEILDRVGLLKLQDQDKE